MSRSIYLLLDAFFLAFHSSLILFNLLGWIWKKTRRLNFITLSLTAFSWFILGIWYGWGYCFCTDWHWQVRHHLGYHDMPRSYITFLIRYFTGWTPNSMLVDVSALVLFLAALGASIYVNFYLDSRDLG